jgi:NAD(P)-dependent dehydrogenase (short-subunit alcohol dehydrogenase family)
VVCNNAGVSLSGLSWTHTTADWEWVLGVNLWGVIHGIRSFVPILLEQGEPGHVVNTASMAALTSMPLSAAYNVSKHGVLALSETLHHEITQRGAPIGVSAVCPEVIATGIADGARNRPPELAREGRPSPEQQLADAAIRAQMQHGRPPAVIAERVERAIRDGRFYVLCDADDPWRETCAARLEDIRRERNPTLVLPVPA